jgi:hypothetical protein
MPLLLAPTNVVIPIGIDYIDRFIGGQQPGRCHGFLTASGEGNTAQMIDPMGLRRASS